LRQALVGGAHLLDQALAFAGGAEFDAADLLSGSAVASAQSCGRQVHVLLGHLENRYIAMTSPRLRAAAVRSERFYIRHKRRCDRCAWSLVTLRISDETPFEGMSSGQQECHPGNKMGQEIANGTRRFQHQALIYKGADEYLALINLAFDEGRSWSLRRPLAARRRAGAGGDHPQADLPRGRDRGERHLQY
jgi:hypothetical protein